VCNDTSDTIPEWAWLELTGSLTADGAAKVRKATRGGLAGLVNGPVPLAPGDQGDAYPPWSDGIRLAVHASDTVTASDTLGPKIGDWYCRVGQPGFRPVGPAFAGLVPVVAESGGVTSGMLVAMSTAANAGTQWTTGLVQAYTVTGDLVAANPLETVEMRPLYPTDKLVNGQSYLCVDTGARGAAGRRRLRAERLGGNGTPTGYVRVVTDVVCVGDDLVKTYTNIPVYS
jgi:hypothetical protein